MNKIFDKINRLISQNSLLPRMKFQHIKRPIRFRVNHIHRVKFLTMNNEEIQICNISCEGIGLQTSSFPLKPHKSQLINGTLIINEKPLKAVLKVAYVTEVVGCSIVNFENFEKHVIAEYFSHELAALALYPLSSENLKKDPDGKANCLVGEDNCELFFVENGKKLVKFNITLFGTYMEVNRDKVIYFGKVLDTDDSGPLKYKKSDLIEALNFKVTPELKEGMVRFISNIDNISDEYKNEMIEIVKKAS